MSGAGNSRSSTPKRSPDERRLWKGFLRLAIDVGDTSGGELRNVTTFLSAAALISISTPLPSTTMLSLANVVLRIVSSGRSDFGGSGGGLLSVVELEAAADFLDMIRSVTDKTSTD